MRSGHLDEHMAASKQEALGGGHYGWLDDGLASVAPWGFDLAAVRAPVLLLQGGEDLMVPPSHARAMAAILPNATLEFHPDEGHMTLALAPDRPLDWLLPLLREPRALTKGRDAGGRSGRAATRPWPDPCARCRSTDHAFIEPDAVPPVLRPDDGRSTLRITPREIR
jgi:hypothetical protein